MQDLSTKREFSIRRFFFQWEWGLVILFLLVNLINTLLSKNYLTPSKLATITRSFLDKSFLVLPMCMVLMLGEIDISIASIIALSSTAMAVTHQLAGLPMLVAILICLLVGTLCGAFNGLLLVKFPELPPMIVTFFGRLLYRGIAEYALKGEALSNYPDWFFVLGWNNILGVPIMFWSFLFFAVVFYLIIHKSVFGRYVLAIGSNRTTARYSGINVQRIRFMVYTIVGFMAAVTSLFLTSRTSSTRSDIAMGYELDIIAIVILGGISTSGGKGKLLGPVIAIFIIGYLRYGLGLVNIESTYLISIIGALLVVSSLLPNLLFSREFRVRELESE